jgi:DNA-binding NtrC family response regulator
LILLLSLAILRNERLRSVEDGEREGGSVRQTIHFYQPESTLMANKKNSILVVDDEDALRTVLSSELMNEGYEVHTAADGDEAISELGKAQFDLVLLDIKMPRMNGFEVLKHIREKHGKTKVVMLTGFADLKNAIESKKLGADDFVSKPYDLVDLLTTIERVLTE